MQDRQLHAFIEHARQKGMDHSTIRMLLLSAGWKEKEIARALTEQALEMPVPVPPDMGGAREAFFHLLAFAGLYTTVIGVVVFFFLYIDRLFPDPAFPNPNASETWELKSIRWWVAALIVAFPVLLSLSRFLLREMTLQPEKAQSGIRRWLTYLTLFFAALALGGDLITLIYYLLEDELSTRFVLKVATVLVVAGLTFAYYFLSLRMPPVGLRTARMHRAFAGAATGVVLVALVWGCIRAGTPGTERLKKFDEVRLGDLRSIEREIQAICLGERRWSKPEERALERPLPESLEAVVKEAKEKRPSIRDPETGAPYGYEPTGGTRYRVCATFRFARNEDADVFWNHPPGPHCFELDVMESAR